MEPGKIADALPMHDMLPVRRVLVIEDTPAFAQSALELENCKISVAGSLKAAIRLMREQQFDMVLSDLNFPSADGGAPKRQDLAIAVHCLWNNLPLAVVTRGDPGTEQHIRSTFINIHTFTPDDLVHCLAEHGFVNRFNKTQQKAPAKFDILSPGHDVYFRMLAKDCTMQRERLMGQAAKTPEVWKQALGMLEASISKRRGGMLAVFEKSGNEGKRVYVRQAGDYQGIPNARPKAQPMLMR